MDQLSASQPMPVVALRGVSKTYASGVQALVGFDLDIRSGEFVSILDPFGSIARIDRRNGNLGEHPTGKRRHHYDPLRKKNGLEDRMRDEDDRSLQVMPQAEQLIIQFEARDLIQRRAAMGETT